MKAGFAEVEYTPKTGFTPGEFQAYFAKGAYTPLQANAAAFENNGETVILISADHLLFHSAYANTIREGTSAVSRRGPEPECVCHPFPAPGKSDRDELCGACRDRGKPFAVAAYRYA